MVDIYQAMKRQGKYPPLANDTEVNNYIYHKIVMQGFLVVYHGISHSSLVVSLHTHSPKGSCVYEVNTSDEWDIPWYTGVITSTH